jgi:hypothetical protein
VLIQSYRYPTTVILSHHGQRIKFHDVRQVALEALEPNDPTSKVNCFALPRGSGASCVTRELLHKIAGRVWLSDNPRLLFISAQ